MRPKHKRITRTKALVAAGGAAVVAFAGVMLPQAFADNESAGNGADSAQTTLANLKSARQAMSQQANVTGTAWAIDPKAGQIILTADRTVTGAKWDNLMSTVNTMGNGKVQVKKSNGEFRLFASGGDGIFASGGGTCSLGFNVTTSDGNPGFLTAGHCGVAAQQWSDTAGGEPVATITEATFPGDGDFALATYDDPATEAPSEVDTGRKTVAITEAAEAEVGMQVQRMGTTTGLNDGEVTGLDATVTYPEGTVTGLIQTNVCAEPGDSGGSLFTAEGQAIGLTSGGSGDCTSGGETFFAPVTTALKAVGATIGEGDGEGDGDDQGDDQGDGQGNDQEQSFRPEVPGRR